MYHYVDDKNFLSRMRQLCGEIMQDFCHILKEKYDIGANFYLVGSGKRNLILQNADEPIDLDYNLEIKRCENFDDAHYIKESARKAFNKALNNQDSGNCEDSTSSLTSKRICLKKGNQTPFSIDVCIVYEDENGDIQRLIHDKTGFTYLDRYYRNLAPNSKRLREKADIIKKSGNWNMLRDEYLNIKNHNLRFNYNRKPSFVCYTEAVNIVYNRIYNRINLNRYIRF